MSWWVNLRSTRAGIRAMQRPFPADETQPKWAIRCSRGFWCHLWTPIWHKGRGPYVTIGLGLFAIYRGY